MKIWHLFFMICLSAVILPGCSKNKNANKLDLLAFSCEQDPYEGNVVAYGKISNITEKPINNITGMVELRGPGDKLVGTWSDQIVPNPLPPNRSAEFTLQTQYRVENGTCRVWVANTMGRTILKNRQFKPITTVPP